MENTAIYQTIMFNKTMPFIIVHHTNYSSTPITSHWHPDLEMSILPGLTPKTQPTIFDFIFTKICANLNIFPQGIPTQNDP